MESRNSCRRNGRRITRTAIRTADAFDIQVETLWISIRGAVDYQDGGGRIIGTGTATTIIFLREIQSQIRRMSVRNPIVVKLESILTMTYLGGMRITTHIS
jgi:hypothetical protein